MFFGSSITRLAYEFFNNVAEKKEGKGKTKSTWNVGLNYSVIAKEEKKFFSL